MEFRNIEFRNDSTVKGIISGYAIVFNQISNVLYDSDRRRYFQEMILPSSITQGLLDNSDIIFNINHERDKMVARRFHGKGSLYVELREDGVYFSFKVPNTQLGRDLQEMIERGEVFDCSFTFTDVDAKWDFTNRECPMRTVTNITGIYDMCACWNGAYSQTEINSRSIEDLEEQYKAELKEIKPIEELKEEAGVIEDNKERGMKLKVEIEVEKTEDKECEKPNEALAPDMPPENDDRGCGEKDNRGCKENRNDDSYLDALKPYRDILENINK